MPILSLEKEKKISVKFQEVFNRITIHNQKESITADTNPFTQKHEPSNRVQISLTTKQNV